MARQRSENIGRKKGKVIGHGKKKKAKKMKNFPDNSHPLSNIHSQYKTGECTWGDPWR